MQSKTPTFEMTAAEKRLQLALEGAKRKAYKATAIEMAYRRRLIEMLLARKVPQRDVAKLVGMSLYVLRTRYV